MKDHLRVVFLPPSDKADRAGADTHAGNESRARENSLRSQQRRASQQKNRH